jgi:hypothetical protein
VTKSVLKERFASTGEVIAEVKRMLTEVSKNGFKEYFQKLYENSQKCVTDQGNYYERNVV